MCDNLLRVAGKRWLRREPKTAFSDVDWNMPKSINGRQWADDDDEDNDTSPNRFTTEIIFAYLEKIIITRKIFNKIILNDFIYKGC